MSWGGNNNNKSRPWIEVNFGRPQPPQPIVEVDIGRRSGYSNAYGSRPMVEVDVFGGVPRPPPPPPPRPVIEVDIINRQQQYAGYPAYTPAQPAVVVTTQQQQQPYPPNAGYNNGYGGNGYDVYGGSRYGNNYPPEHFNNPRW